MQRRDTRARRGPKSSSTRPPSAREGPSPAGDLPRIEGIDLSATALEVTDPALPRTRWEAALRRLAPLDRGSAWWLGDLLVLGEKRYGETYVEAASATGLSARTLRNRASVARRVPPENREPRLPWRAHRTVAPLAPEEQRRWLKRAAANDWTSDELARELRGSSSSEEDDDWPDPEDQGADEADAGDGHRDFRCPRCRFEWDGEARPAVAA